MRLDSEAVVPRARRRPYLGQLQEVGVDESGQMRCVTKRGHATVGMCSPSSSVAEDQRNKESRTVSRSGVERVPPAVEDAVVLEVGEFGDVAPTDLEHE